MRTQLIDIVPHEAFKDRFTNDRRSFKWNAQAAYARLSMDVNHEKPVGWMTIDLENLTATLGSLKVKDGCKVDLGKTAYCWPHARVEPVPLSEVNDIFMQYGLKVVLKTR